MLSLWLLWIPAFIAQLYYLATSQWERRDIVSLLLTSCLVLLFYPIILPVLSIILLWKNRPIHHHVDALQKNSNGDDIETISLNVN